MTASSVLLTTDGTYPCYRGGVSVWCDQLVKRLSSTPFHIFAVTYSPSHSPVFTRPSNVLSQHILPLWGTEEPGLELDKLSASLLRKLLTTRQRIETQFLPHFRLLVQTILNNPAGTDALAESLLAMHEYFQSFDYASTMTSEVVWETFLHLCCNHFPPHDRPSLEDATTCMRWLQRLLAVVSVPLPDTDIVHASMSGLAGVPGVIQKLRIRSRFLITEHGIFLRELYLSLANMKATLHCRRFMYRLYETLVTMNYSYADSVTSLCEFNRKWQIRMGASRHKIELTPNGVDESKFRPAEPGERQDASPVVLTLARIYALKGIYDLIQTAHLVVQKIPNVKFRILGEVGDAAYHASCLDLANRLGVTNALEWGLTNDPPSAYRQADIFCSPSISEGMPYAVLEAMFSACPVVATDVGGVSEMLAGTGLVVPPRDPAAMAGAILSLLNADGSSKRSDLAVRARKRARSLYTIDKSLQRFEEIYGQLSKPAGVTRLSAAG